MREPGRDSRVCGSDVGAGDDTLTRGSAAGGATRDAGGSAHVVGRSPPSSVRRRSGIGRGDARSRPLQRAEEPPGPRSAPPPRRRSGTPGLPGPPAPEGRASGQGAPGRGGPASQKAPQGPGRAPLARQFSLPAVARIREAAPTAQPLPSRIVAGAPSLPDDCACPPGRSWNREGPCSPSLRRRATGSRARPSTPPGERARRDSGPGILNRGPPRGPRRAPAVQIASIRGTDPKNPPASSDGPRTGGSPGPPRPERPSPPGRARGTSAGTGEGAGSRRPRGPGPESGAAFRETHPRPSLRPLRPAAPGSSRPSTAA